MNTFDGLITRGLMRNAAVLILMSAVYAHAEIALLVGAVVDKAGQGVELFWRHPECVISCADAEEYGDLDEASWQLVPTPAGTAGSLVDSGSDGRTPPGDLSSGMRFYRFAKAGTDFEVVYVARNLVLEEGRNFMSLWMRPVDSTVAGVFGTKHLPSGAGPADSTVISFYDATADASPRPVTLWLSSEGTWRYSTGGEANHERIPYGKGFCVTIPAGAGPQRLLTVGRVPDQDETRQIAGDPKGVVYNFVGIGVPARTTMAATGLREAGLRAGPNVGAADEIRILARGGAERTAPKARIFLNELEGGKYWFGYGGQGSAEKYAIEPDDALIVIRRHGEPLTQWMRKLPYSPPDT